MNGSEPLEIERRFLILRPDTAELDRRCTRVYSMEQTYLLSPPHQTERVRRREGQDGVAFFHTVKIDRTALTRLEQEETITPEAYEAYLSRRDPMTQTICKTRYCLPEGPYTFEIDLYPFWPHYAVMEIELPREDAPFRFPHGIRVIRELTGDRRFSNAALSRRIPAENELL